MAEITCDALGRAIFAALRDSPEILGECQTRFDKAHAVFLGATGRESPGPDYYPVFVVVPWGKERGEDEDRRTFNFSVFLELEDEVEDGETYGGAVTRMYRGAQSLEVLLDLAQTAIEGVSGDLDLIDLSFGFNPIEYFPVMVGELEFTASFPALIGGYEPAL